MTISFDYDHTWTAIPDELNIFCLLLKKMGHTVIITTGRKEWSDDMLRCPVPAYIPVIYAGSKWKREAALEAGYAVDIWVDDMPETIGQSLLVNI